MNPGLNASPPPDPFGIDRPVAWVDRYVIRPGNQQRVYNLVVHAYTAHLAARGMRLVGAWLSPPFDQPDAPSELHAIWEYPSLASLWSARMDEETDPVARRLWADLAPLIESRARGIARTAPMPIPPPETPPPATAQPAFTRRILFIHPAEPLINPTQWVQAARANHPTIRVSALGPNGDHSFAPGDLTWDIAATTPIDDAACLAMLPAPATIAQAVTIGRVLAAGTRRPDLSGTKRTILLRTRPDAAPSAIEAFEQKLAAVPLWIEDITNWRLSRVAPDATTNWTHCFEQEVADPAVFTGNYLHHPYHWAVVERLFHPDAPERVTDGFFQTLYPIDRSVLARL